MLEKIKYSFVLPAYKSKYLREAIDSILGQTYPGFELIIVNDASPEELDSIVNTYDDERIRYYRNKENIGAKDLVKQWNNSISYAKGDYLILASDDDVYSAEYLQNMDVMVQKYPEVNVFRPKVKRIDRNGKIIGIDGFVCEYMSKLEYFFAWARGWLKSGIPFFLFKRDALMEIGGFVNYPLAWFSDDATVLKLSYSGVVTCDKVLFTFRLANESISTAKNTKASLKAKYQATEMFYEEFVAMMSDYVPANDEEANLLSAMKHDFPRLVRKSKVRSQLKVSSFSTIISTAGEGRKIDCVNIFDILSGCRYPILACLKRIFAFKHKYSLLL